MNKIDRILGIGIPHVVGDRVGHPYAGIRQEFSHIGDLDTRIIAIKIFDLILIGQRLHILIDLIVVNGIRHDRPHLLAGQSLGGLRSRGNAQTDNDQIADQKECQRQKDRL